MTDKRGIVIGIDGGGTSTRALCADLDGRVLAHACGAGTNPEHNSMARENVQGVLRSVLAEAGREPCEVRALVAGLAGIDRPSDLAWAEDFTRLDGLTAPRRLLNDAQIAHAGALRGRPGIVAVLGTGAMIWAITESGRNLRDFDFGYYSASASRYVALAAVNRILADGAGEAAAPFVAEVCAHFGVTGVDGLREFASGYVTGPYEEMKRRYGSLAPVVTRAAMERSSLAEEVCRTFVRNVVRAFGILGGCFSSRPVLISVVGSVGTSDFYRREIPIELEATYPRRFEVIVPELSPLAGAILLALEAAGVDAPRGADALRAHPAARMELA